MQVIGSRITVLPARLTRRGLVALGGVHQRRPTRRVRGLDMRHSQPVSVPGQQEHHRRVPPRRRAHEGGASVASLPGQQTSSVLEKRLSRGDVPFRAGSVQRRQVGLHRRVRDAGRRGQA